MLEGLVPAVMLGVVLLIDFGELWVEFILSRLWSGTWS